MKPVLLWAVRHPAAAAALFILATLFFGYQASRLQIDASSEGLMLESDPARGFYERAKATFGSDELTVIVVKADDVFTPAALAAIEQVSRAVERIDGVTRVDSLATIDNISASGDALEIAPLLRGGIPHDPRDLARMRAKALANPVFAGNLVAADAKAAGILIYTQPRDGDRGFNHRFVRAVDEVIARNTAAGVSAYQVGGPLIKATYVDYIERDQLTLIPLSAATLFLVLLVGFRTPQGVVAPIVTGLSSIVWGDQRIAVIRTMAIQARPIVFISLALAAGFGVLSFSQFVPTVHLAFLSAFVMLAAMVAELVLAPILLSSTQLVTLWNMVLLKMNPELARRAPLFAGLSQWEARKVVLMGMLRPLAPRELAVRRGEQGRELYMVVTGRLVITDVDLDGTERTLAIVEPGGVFGETGIVGDAYRTFSARAETASEVLRLDFDAFERLRKPFPYTAAKVFRNLAKILSERLQDTTTAMLYPSSGAAPGVETSAFKR